MWLAARAAGMLDGSVLVTLLFKPSNGEYKGDEGVKMEPGSLVGYFWWVL